MNIQHYKQRLLDLEKTLSARIGHEATRAGENSSTRPMTPQLQIVNAASLPQNKMMRGIDAVGARVVPALHREDIDRSRAAEISDGHT
jgi:hypothetical protein